MKRRSSRKIFVGGVPIGGDAPISVQSMCNTDTRDVSATCRQINELENAGCQIVRLAVVDYDAARSIHEIAKQVQLPIVADIHFDYKLALEAIQAGASKIRINPGNIGDIDRVRQVADACRQAGIPIRIGVNAGSLEPALLVKYGDVCADAMVESALNHIELLNRFDFEDICVSIKASSVTLTIEAYRKLAQRMSYPLHLGVTETGTIHMGTIKSAIGIGSLLCDGIGDTVRVSLTADPVAEVKTALDILKATGLRKTGVELISCPSCGRCRINLIEIASKVEERLSDIAAPIKVAVMGCVVNGPGEAREADVGIAGGEKCGLLFSHGEVVKKVPMESIVDELEILARKIASENSGEI